MKFKALPAELDRRIERAPHSSGKSPASVLAFALEAVGGLIQVEMAVSPHHLLNCEGDVADSSDSYARRASRAAEVLQAAVCS